MNYILGSGLIAFIAKDIFPDYQILPIGKTRFYRYDIATCDDYIVYDKKIDQYMTDRWKSPLPPIYFKRAYSISGKIIYNTNLPYIDQWLQKVYGDDQPQIAEDWMQDGFVYPTRGTDMFQKLETDCLKSVREFISSKDQVLSIDAQNKIIRTEHKELEYDKIISTIPRNYLFLLLGIKAELSKQNLYTFVVKTNDLNFEGASELLVVDNEIDFYKCTNLGNETYQFFTNVDIQDITGYLQNFISNFNLIKGTCIIDAVYKGDPHDALIPDDIKCVGASACWNDLIDLRMSIRQLL